MRELDKNKVYSLEELTSEELKDVLTWLKKNDENWDTCPFEEMIKYQKTDRLVFNTHNWKWSNTIESTTNAKELFYTLENVQVDCRDLSYEQIKDMADVFKKNGIPTDFNDLHKTSDCYYLHKGDNLCFVRDKDRDKPYEITYEKFMELFCEQDKRNGWYTYGSKGKGNWLMYYDFNKNKIYGFCEYDGTWFENSFKLYLDGDSILASKEVVEERLIKEAEKRGFKGSFEYDPVYNELWCEKTSIFRDGVWGEPASENLKPLFEGVALLDEVKREGPLEWSKSLRGEELKPQYFQMAGRGEIRNCYYFYHSEKHGPNFYTKEEIPYHDGEDWKEDLVVYTQLGSGKKFVTTKERFKKFKEVWV